ncbi:MAG: glycosyltransferase [Deltaproteobacteria bacterium]|nr:glycosyltransferase [Deltaproteobacteria bacterium]
MFPSTDPAWAQVADFLRAKLRDGEEILAPREFLDLFAGAYGYRAAYALSPERFTFVVVHMGMLREVGRRRLTAFRHRLAPVFGNDVFVVLGPADRAQGVSRRTLAAVEKLAPRGLHAPRADASPVSAAVLTTHDRPDALARSLPQVVALGVEVLVVDDGSAEAAAGEIEAICRAHGARRLRFEENRGLPNAVNAGIGYWLADPAVDWISLFNDDVDVRPDALEMLARVQDPRTRPLLTGRSDPLHSDFGGDTIDGVEVRWLRSAPGVHLHGHRDYWRDVLPIPTPYLAAPKRDGGLPGQGADEDFWITCWSPRSIAKRGGYVACIPGLVRTLTHQPLDSTWSEGSAAAEDPPLAPPPRATSA